MITAKLPAPLGDTGAWIRRAEAEDLTGIVAMLADDVLGATRESADLDRYRAAFDAIDADPRHLLGVAEDQVGLSGVLQLTLIPGLSRSAATRAQIEGVRAAGRARGTGLGTALLTWAIAVARENGAGLVQLTSDSSRADAHRFYRSLGFTASHTGFKLDLNQ